MSIESKESVYTILSKILKLKFYTQIKDSGIDLEGIYRMTNLQSGKEHYLLIVNNKEIKFISCQDFIFHFSNYLSSNIRYFNDRYNKLRSHSSNEYTDEIALEREYKEIDFYRYKQSELLKLMLEFRNKLKR